MAKHAKNLPAVNSAGQSGVAVVTPAFLSDAVANDAGKGVSTDQSDNLIPLIYVLQPLSPACNKRDPAHIEGAEPGALWLKNSAHPIVDGETGIVFQPCYFSKDWVEWVPRENGGGFAGRHPTLPKEAKEHRDPKNPQKVKYVMPNGNECIETRYHAGFVLTPQGPLPYVIPMSSTAHTASRQLMFMMNSKQMNGKKLPSWACTYRLKTKQKSNAAGTWFTWAIEDEGYVSSLEQYNLGKSLFDAFNTGAKTAAEEDATHAVDSDEAM
jgi:hypothetical protein